jgi:Zn-dependent protease with chaperone function
VDLLYPAGPAAVPAKLTSPSLRYRLHAWLALAGLLLFMTVYFALAGWFGWTAYRLLAGLLNGPAEAFGMFLAGTGAAFLALFMLKALLFVKRSGGSEGIQVTAQEQPALFAFLHRLADDAGAPRPHRVYLSGHVNAGVFYDLSIANLLIPSRKSLEIGLALVNVLSLGELKAVLAHEFGHFAQRTMAVGRWVYIAQQIAGHIVARRDAFDAFLARLSRVDPRIAWIGWLLSVIVWSIRSLLDFFFRIVLLAQRALGREMELQADLVAVSVTGSDALVHALYRLGAADQAWDRAVEFANGELRAGRGVKDLFALQTRIIDNMRKVLDDPGYGAVPALPVSQPESHRLFKAAIAAPPRMWSTHPASVDREHNAKRLYVAASIDERSAWTLFVDPQALRERISAHLTRGAQGPIAPPEETLARVDEQYSRAYLDPIYRGVYLGRSIVREARRAEELYGPLPAGDGVRAELDSLYPASLSSHLARLRALEEEEGLLTALRKGLLTAPGGVILHRGEAISRKALPRAIEAVQKETAACAELLREHDRRCRSAHLAAAGGLGEDWAAYLRGLLQLLHYADHVEANLLDARDLLMSAVTTATAGTGVSAEQRRRVLHCADTAYAALREVHQSADSVSADRTVLRRMKKASWREALEPLRLPAPTAANLGDWLGAADGWMRSTLSSLAGLRLAALEQLLLSETQIARFVRQGIKPAAAPPASQAPQSYRLLLPGSERPRQQLGWWDRFQTASGVLPMILRSAAAAAIVGVALLVSTYVGTSSVYVFNGLGRPVLVRLGERRISVPSFSHREVNVGNDKQLHVSTTTADGRPIEQFDAAMDGWAARKIYNVAGAAALVSWQAAYGNAVPGPTQFLGAPRWSAPRADVVFEKPPSSIKANGGGTRNVLTGLAGEQPGAVLGALPDARARNAVAAAHLRWDADDTRYVSFWVAYAAAAVPNAVDLIRLRVADDPTDTFNLRLEQQLAPGAQHETICARHRQMAAAAPDSPDLQYLAARCIQDPDEQDRTFLTLHQRWPQSPWLDFAAGYVLAEEARWQEALPLIDAASLRLPGLTEQLTVMSARVRRVLAGSGEADLSELRARSELLQSLGAAEFGEGRSAGPQDAYAFLARGDLGGALERAGSDEERARLLRLVAASDGAPAAQIERALQLPPEKGLDADTLLPTLAVAVRAGRSLEPFKQAAARILGQDAERALNAFSLLKGTADHAQVEAALRRLDPEARGHLYVAAVILRGNACPADWRMASRRLLFASERPYLGEHPPGR